MNVTLTARLERYVHKKVESGRYQSPSEVVEDAVRLMEQQERLRAARLAELRRQIDEGLASLDRGEGVDGEAFVAELIASLEAKPVRRRTK